MEETKKLTFADVKKRIGEHLKTALGIEEFEITFAKQTDNEWRVNVEWNEKIGKIEWSRTAAFKLDAETGEVMEFQKGSYWRF